MKFISIILLIGLIANIFHFSSAEETSPFMKTLTDSNFTKSTEDGKWFVMFYAPWCGHCNRLKPTWNELANSVHTDINIAMLDATVNKKTAQTFQIKGYPTLILMNNGEAMMYNQARTLEDMSAFALSNLNNVEKKIKKNEPTIQKYVKSFKETFIHEVKAFPQNLHLLVNRYPYALLIICIFVFSLGFLVSAIIKSTTEMPPSPSPPASTQYTTRSKKD